MSEPPELKLEVSELLTYDILETDTVSQEEQLGLLTADPPPPVPQFYLFECFKAGFHFSPG